MNDATQAYGHFSEVAGAAAGVWQIALMHLNWHHGLVASTYLGAAWLCLLNMQASKDDAPLRRLWAIAAVVLCLMGANTILQADVFVTQFVRAAARVQGWYTQRRLLQYGLVLLLASGFLFAVAKWRAAFVAYGVQPQRVVLGLVILMFISAMRLVSAHATDQVLSFSLAGISVGRLLELAAIGIVALAARERLRLR